MIMLLIIEAELWVHGNSLYSFIPVGEYLKFAKIRHSKGFVEKSKERASMQGCTVKVLPL